MNKNKRNIIISVVLIVLALVFTILVKKVGVKPVGVNGSDLGFASINTAFNNFTGTHMKLYKISEIAGIIAIAFAAFYAFIGALELVNRKSLFKVDKEIIITGAFYALVILVYLIFEKVVINYRPLLIDGQMEASYPSSHTLLSLCICLSSVLVSKRVLKKNVSKYANIIAIITMLVILIGRTFSGVHWFTDIIGGIIISSALLMSYYTVLEIIKNK